MSNSNPPNTNSATGFGVGAVIAAVIGAAIVISNNSGPRAPNLGTTNPSGFQGDPVSESYGPFGGGGQSSQGNAGGSAIRPQAGQDVVKLKADADAAYDRLQEAIRSGNTGAQAIAHTNYEQAKRKLEAAQQAAQP